MRLVVDDDAFNKYLQFSLLASLKVNSVTCAGTCSFLMKDGEGGPQHSVVSKQGVQQCCYS